MSLQKQNLNPCRTLAKATDRQPSNLSRTLKTLANYGFVELKKKDKKIIPVAKATEFEIHAA